MEQHDFIKIGDCEISPTATILNGSIIGKKYRRLLNGFHEADAKTIIHDNVYIGYSCIVGNGSVIRKNSILDDKSILESNIDIGENNLIIYGAQICSSAKIGNGCVIGGLIGERTIVGNYCRIFGKIVHSQINPLRNWDSENSKEDSSEIYDNVFIGFDAIIAGPVKIGPRAYICTGSIVTKNVSEGYIAQPGVNNLIHHSKIISSLRYSDIFK